MTTTDSRIKSGLSYAICYGLADGPAHARRLNALLQKSGYTSTTAEQADIIIAHSAGCWLIPPRARPKLVIYIGMPLAQTVPRRSWWQATVNNFRSGVLSGLRVRYKSTYYGLRQPRRNLGIIRMAKTARPTIFPEAAGVFIVNRYDPWPRAEQLQQLLAERDWAFIGFGGAHDDIWEHSERYAAIIDHYAGLLAQTNR